MKFFLDTANLNEIREVAGWGILDGVTTNPSLVAKENLKFEDLIRDICGIVSGPVSVECVSDKAPDIISEGRELAKLAPNIAVKIPITIEGLKAIKVLSSAKGSWSIRRSIFSSTQALLAAKAGAKFVSPFIGRLDDISQEGMGLIEEIVTIFENYRFADRSHRRQHPPSAPCRGRRPSRRGYLHHPLRGHGEACQASADRSRHRTLHEGLGQGQKIAQAGLEGRRTMTKTRRLRSLSS